MYNETLKLDFIDSYVKSASGASAYVYLFNTAEKYEEKYSKDISEFNDSELHDFINDIQGFTVGTSQMTISRVKSYVLWVKKNHKEINVSESIYRISNIDIDDDKIRRSFVSNPLHLKLTLDSIFGSVKNNDLNNIFRCYLWMGYMGIPEQDTIFVENDDVDFYNQYITYNGRQYMLYPESIPEFKSCVNDTAFIINTNFYERMYSRAPGNKIMRMVKTNNIKLANIRERFSKAVNQSYKSGNCKVSLTFKRIQKSGVYYRLYQLEYATQVMLPKHMFDNAGVDEKDYNKWKSAFYLSK